MMPACLQSTYGNPSTAVIPVDVQWSDPDDGRTQRSQGWQDVFVIVRLANNEIGNFHPVKQLLLIRLFQHATICSVRACRAPRFRRICASFSVNSRAKKPARITWRRVAGQRASDVHGVDTRARIAS